MAAPDLLSLFTNDEREQGLKVECRRVWCSVPPVSGGNKPFKYSVKIITRLTRRIASHVGNPVAVSEAKNLLFKLWGHPNFEGW
jgi:hypothetical protein